MWRKNCVAAVPAHFRLLYQSRGRNLRSLATHRRDFVSARSELGRWRNDSPEGGLTELYVYQGWRIYKSYFIITQMQTYMTENVSN